MKKSFLNLGLKISGWLLIAIMSASTTSHAQEPSPEQLTNAAMCLQSGLNDIGYDAGVVDGQIGAGTKRAFIKFRPNIPQLYHDVPLPDLALASWCLMISRDYEVSTATKSLANKVASSATVVINIDINPEVNFKIVLLDKENQQTPIEAQPQPSEVNGRQARSVSFPYSVASEAIRYCAMLGKGWIVKDSNGKPHQFFRQKRDFAFTISPYYLYAIPVEKSTE